MPPTVIAGGVRVGDPRWDADRYAGTAAFVPRFGEALLAWLRPRPGEVILDLGCGEGSLTRQLAGSGARVVGLDASESMVERARLAGVDAVCLDAARMRYSAEFDAVFSNAALHWMPDLPALLGRVSQALRPGGRLVAEMGGAGNVFQVRQALAAELATLGLDARVLDPWVFPDCRRMRGWLAAAGLAARQCRLFARPTVLPGSLSDWLEVFAPAFLAPLSAAQREALVAGVEHRLRPRLWDEDRGWVLDYVRLRFAADKPGP